MAPQKAKKNKARKEVHKGTKVQKDAPIDKKTRKTYGPEVVRMAIESVKTNKLSLRRAARVFGIPTSTLFDKVKRTLWNPILYSVLTTREERKLTNYLDEMGRKGFGMTAKEVRQIAKSIIDLRQPPRPECPDENMPCNSWVYRFFRRHPNLNFRAQRVSKDKAAVSPETVALWFQRLKQFIEENDPTILENPSRIYNADEGGFQLGPEFKEVMAFTGSEDCPADSSQVTVAVCVSASGNFIKPLIIYPHDAMPTSSQKKDFPGAAYSFSEEGYHTAFTFTSWLKYIFVPATADVKKPVLLLLDGNKTHTTSTETKEICEQHGILLYYILSLASDIIQPLDKGFFELLKLAWSKKRRQRLSSTGKDMSLESFASFLRPVWKKCCLPHVAQHAFKCAGIVPWNPDEVIFSGKFGRTFLAQPECMPEAEEILRATSRTSQDSENEDGDTGCAQDEEDPIDDDDDELETWSLCKEEEITDPCSSAAVPIVEIDKVETESLGEEEEMAEASSSAAVPVAVVPNSSTAACVGERFPPSKLLSNLELQTFKTFMEFALDSIPRKDLTKYMAVLDGTQEDPKEEKFNEFLLNLSSFRNATRATVSLVTTKTSAKTVRVSLDNAPQLPLISLKEEGQN